MSGADGMATRSVPLFCPYCSDEGLRPGEDAGTWSCEACTRSFALRQVRPGRSPAQATAGPPPALVGGTTSTVEETS